MRRAIRYTRLRYFCDVIGCAKEDMDRLLESHFIRTLPPDVSGTGLYKEDQVIKWFNQCLKEGFTLSQTIPKGYQHYYGFIK